MEEKLARQEAEHETDHAQSKIGKQLADEKLSRAHGRDKKRLERSPLPFPGNHHGGEERSDDRHHHDDQARDQEIMAVVVLVEPHPIDNDHRAAQVAPTDPACAALHSATGPWA